MAQSELKVTKPGWKQRALREFTAYWINVLYLSCFLGLFAWYRRLVLASYQITYLNYGVALLEALVMAKVILIGDALRLGRGFEQHSLIFPTLYKAAIFTAFLGAFGVFEHEVSGLWRGEGLAGGLKKIASSGKYELLARCLVMFFAFIPFFAFRELGRVLGEGKLGALFFRRTAAS
jgi:hypothetical protein